MPGETRRRDEYSIKALLISLAASAGVGVVMSYLFIPRSVSAGLVQIGLFGAIGGLLIGLPFIYVERLFGPFLDSFSGGRVRMFLRSIFYVVAALIGFGLGFPVAGLIVFGTLITIPYAGGLIAPALFAAAGGLVIYSYSLLKSRLEESLVRIKEQEFAEKELELARSIQQRLLPPAEIDGSGYGIVARNIAATYVAGDFYDVFHLQDGSVGITVADVAGKGMGASLIMSTAKAMLPLIAADRSVPETLRELNLRLRRDLGPREFVALAYARFDPATGRVELGNAGLPNPFVIGLAAADEIDVPGPRVPLGMMKDVPYQSVTFDLATDARFMLFSDGLPEAPVGGDDQLGYDELRQILLDTPSGDAASWIDAVLATILSRTPAGPDDDCTAMLLERRPLERPSELTQSG